MAEKFFSDDYQNLDKDGNIIGDKAAYVSMTKIFMNAFNDFKGVVHDISEDDGGVILTFHWEGTHTGDFDLSAMGMGVIPASGKRFVTPESSSEFVIKGDKIVSIKPYGDSDGFKDFLAPLGVKLPAA